MKKTHEIFEEELKNRTLNPLDIYINARTKIRFKCTKCNWIWKSTPNNILKGQGCPNCANVSRSIKHRKQNKIIKDNGTWLEIDISTKKHPKSIMFIDKKDWNKIKDFGRVYVSSQKRYKTKYARMIINRKQTLVHNTIYNGSMIDHKNRNGLDNRRNNLRKCTNSQNMMNQLVRKDNKCGFRGVYLQSNGKGWCARITKDGKKEHLGTYINICDAVEARLKREIELFGEFSSNYGGGGEVLLRRDESVLSYKEIQ